MLNQSKYIKTIPFSGLFNWSVQYLSETKISFNAAYSLVRIGEFLKRNKTGIEIQDDVRYTRVTIRVRNGGVTIRDTEIGKNIGTKRQFVVSEGQFILSKIDARNGAMGVIPAELEGAIVTQDFLPYDIDAAIINPQYLVLVSTTAEFVAFCQTCSSGTTNRQRIEENKFLDIKIPLPSLAEQNALVAAYNDRIATADSQELQTNIFEQQIEAYLNSCLGIERDDNIKSKGLDFIQFKDTLQRWDTFANKTKLSATVPIVPLGSIIEKISTGTTPPTARKEYFNGNIKFFTPADISDEMYLSGSERYISQVAINENKARIFNKGNILFVGIGSTVGKVGIVKDEIVSSNQQITGFKLRESQIKPEYAFCFLHYNKNITTAEQSKTTIPIVNQDKIANIPIPLPPLEVQNEIVAHITGLKEQIKQLRTAAATNRTTALTNFEQKIFG